VQLFSAVGDVICLISPSSFAGEYQEKRIQSWVDLNPSVVNDGQPMVSLGTEIATKHGLSIDNLFIDDNGCLVAAEMKRGRAPRDVVAQMLDYAAFVSRLKWEDVERFCKKRHGTDLTTKFAHAFGHPLSRNSKPAHRLAIVAESFNPQVTEAAVYLINQGIRLALIEFQLFKVGAETLLQVKTVLGEIPRQGVAKESIDSKGMADDGYNAWLLSSVAKSLLDIATAQGWPLRHRVNQQSLPFVSSDWPLALGDCQFRLDVFKKRFVSLRFSFRKTSAPGLQDLLDKREATWRSRFPAKFDQSDYETVYATLTLDLPRPEIGNKDQLKAILSALGNMTAALRPLVDGYFETNGTSVDRVIEDLTTRAP
jgi:hypothetical protein